MKQDWCASSRNGVASRVRQHTYPSPLSKIRPSPKHTPSLGNCGHPLLLFKNNHDARGRTHPLGVSMARAVPLLHPTASLQKGAIRLAYHLIHFACG